MSETAAKLLEQIRGLPEEDQRYIADELWDEDPDSEDAIAELENDPEFQAMLVERLRSVEEHPELLIDGELVMAELFQKYGGGPL